MLIKHQILNLKTFQFTTRVMATKSRIQNSTNHFTRTMS